MTKLAKESSLQQLGHAPRHILVIDDDPDLCDLVVATAEYLGMACSVANGAQVRCQTLSTDLSLILVDLVMPEVDGIEVLRFLGACGTSAGIIIMSGIGSRVIESAEDLGALLGLRIAGRLQKPFRIDDLEALLRAVPVSMAEAQRSRPKMVTIEWDDLVRAIEQDQFVLHYQPQIDIATGGVVGLEALVRWNHPVYGLVFPADFIPLAEYLRLIERITWVVLEKGLCDHNRLAEAAGLMVRLSVNITTHSLHDLKFPETLSALLARYNVLPEELVLEITESGVVDDLVHTLDVLSRLRVRGVNLSIDDFGTGYSMLRQLRSIPATELKIDKAFVAGMASKTGDRIMVQKTIEIGHELGMCVVAEGVETLEHLEALRRDGCNVAQGYLFTRPLPFAQLLEWLAKYSSGQFLHPPENK